MEDLKNKIKELAGIYASNLKERIEERKEAMKSDDNSHYLIYRVLGITTEEGELIDIYQNTGGFCTNMLVHFWKKPLPCV